MILGHDFHSEAGYQQSVERGSESLSQPTWRNLIDVLGRTGIETAQCFFTNIYMGLRAGDKATGCFPGACDEDFVAHCRRFLSRQIDTQRPALIITLGLHVPTMLASLTHIPKWTAARGLKDLNDSNT